MIALVLFAHAFGAAAGQEPSRRSASKAITNEDVVALIEAGLGGAVVIEKIRASRTAFDTSTGALLALKKAGVPVAVIRVMINPDANGEDQASGTAAVTSQTLDECRVAAGGQQPWMAGASPAMWYSEETSGERVEMQYERGTLHRVGFAGIGATLLLLNPISAALRLKPTAVFYSCINPTDAPLVKFSTDKEDDERNTSVARGGPWNQSFRISEEDLVAIDFRKLPQGLFEIRPKRALAAGEYGFVPQGSAGYFSSGERVYAFGVD